MDLQLILQKKYIDFTESWSEILQTDAKMFL